MKLIDLPNLSNKRLQALSESGINSILDLLNLYPRRYLDRTTVLPIRQLSGQGEEVTVVGRVKKIQQQGYRKKRRLEVIIQDDSAALKGVWFKGGHYVKKQFSEGEVVAFFGKAKRYGRYITMAHPEYDKIGDSTDIQDLKQIVPIYPGNKSLSKAYVTSKLIQQWQKVILKHVNLPEFIPNSVIEKHQLPERHEAYRMIHFPQSQSEYRKALDRFKFEELFLFELSVAKTKY
ncbi:MAG: OB-fold nucleic acid binding domain-containing protein, partial [Balneolaceae bacterium]